MRALDHSGVVETGRKSVTINLDNQSSGLGSIPSFFVSVEIMLRCDDLGGGG
jgi:hypothetical protein